MKYKAVIFDMDGTLLNTIADLTASSNQILEEKGFPPFDEASYCQFVGNGARVLMERIIPSENYSDELAEEMTERFRVVYRGRQNDHTAPYDGIMDLLDRLKALNVPLAILSNKPHGHVREIAAHYFESGLFRFIAGQKEHIPHKPAPDGALAIAEELKIAPEQCLFVGDSSVDMDTAVNAGMAAVGVSWGFRSVEELKAHGARYIINSPLELLPLLAEA